MGKSSRLRAVSVPVPVRERRGARWSWALILTWAALGAGCGSRAELYGGGAACLDAGVCTCLTRADCPQGLRCIDGRCAEPDGVMGPRALGELCELDGQCQSGACRLAGDGSHRRCSQACEASCPEGWQCVPDPLDRLGPLCVQDQLRLCAACADDADCGAAGAGRCFTEGPLAGRCGRDCTQEAACPTGYKCDRLITGDTQCIPDDYTCGCSVPGREVACPNANPVGTCWGKMTCGAGGAFSTCDARAATAEVCNGLDDDCDGLLDEEDPDVDRSGLPAEPAFPACQVGEAESCRGAWRCDVAQGWVCEPAAPSEEVCDGLDNDCDGVPDQTFVDEAGRYVSREHCGGCNRDCNEVLNDLAVDAEGLPLADASACEVRAGASTCRPLRCAPGFAPWPEDAPITCAPAVTVQCMACTDATDCLWSAHRCAALGQDLAAACLQGCGPDAPAPGCTGQLGVRGCCPEGNTCQQVAGAPVCVPDGDGCECNAARAGVKRPCIRPGEAGARCAGEETCEAVGGRFGWSTCDAAEVTREVCNGLDDDCNGVVDDEFVNTRGSGTYDTDAHCGQCYLSCLSLPNARGTCDPGEGPGCVIAQCLPGRVPGGAFCRDDASCPAGYSCDPGIYQCVRRCGAGCTGGDVCVDGFCTMGCGSNSDCSGRFGPESTCDAGVCVAAYRYVDLDESVSNGCECPVLAAGVVDVPDVHPAYPAAGAAYVDRDCDGVDGVVARSLFVREGATNGNGTRDRPFGTLAAALAAYTPAQHDAILVAAGLYAETVALREGVHMYGGYTADFSGRDVAGRPTILAPSEPAAGGPAAVVVARGVRTAGTLAGFVIQGWDPSPSLTAGAPGKTSVAVLVADCGPGLRLVNNLIRGGRGGGGAPGLAGRTGGDGGDGGDGRDARECQTASCAGEQQGGGAGGVNATCGGAAGAAGARSRGDQNDQDYQPPLGRNGRGGTNANYSSANNPQFGQFCKYDCVVQGDLEADDAQNGEAGLDGRGGDGCFEGLGRLAGEAWLASVATAGTVGQLGQGGGGGGAGGSVPNLNPPSCSVGARVGDLGSTGGGGGAGGCGGLAGGAGGAGGASVAVLVVGNGPGDPTLVANRVVRGAGGDGGAGGTGGDGGAGGQGGDGGSAAPPAWCAGGGGKGGRGGDGGRGGGGGGGCGGAAFGVAGRLRNPASMSASNDFSAATLGGDGGRGGAGGRSPAGVGADGTGGSDGEASDVQVLP
jgi:hypothetical protein